MDDFLMANPDNHGEYGGFSGTIPCFYGISIGKSSNRQTGEEQKKMAWRLSTIPSRPKL